MAVNLHLPSGFHCQKARSVDSDLDAEALRVVNSMPKWMPGTQGGKAVNVKYTVPIIFRLTGDTDAADKKGGKD